jgi:hypothetical protein
MGTTIARNHTRVQSCHGAGEAPREVGANVAVLTTSGMPWSAMYADFAVATD